MVGLSLLIGTPFFVLFGWLSDKIGRLKIILAGCLIAAITYIPLFQMLAQSVNPDLVAFQEQNKVTLSTDTATATSTSSWGRGPSSPSAIGPRTS